MIKSFFKEEKRLFFFFIAIFYLAGNWPLLLNEGVFWDDWMVYNMDIQGIYEQFYGNGSPYFGYMHYWLNQLPNPPFIYHLLVVIFQLGTLFISIEIIDSLKWKNSSLLYIVVGLSALTPYFSAKATMICLPYVVCYFLFCLGFYLAILSFQKNNNLLRITSLIVFFISFTTNSLLVFFVVPFTIIFFLPQNYEWNRGFDFKKFLLTAVRLFDFLILPLFFFVVKKVFSPTQGLYAAYNYNEITVNSLFSSPLSIITTFKTSFLSLFNEMLDLLMNKSVEILIIWLFTGLMLHLVTNRKSLKLNLFKSEYNHWYLLAIGIFLFIIGSFPYAAVRKIPYMQSYYDRFQLLLPLGSSLIFVALIFGMTKKIHVRKILLSFVVASFILLNFSYQLQYVRGWFKMESIMQNLPSISYVEENTTFLIVDRAEQWDATEKDIDFHAWNGMLKKTFGSQNRFAAEYQNFDEIMSIIDVYLEEPTRLNMKNYTPSEPDAVIEVKKGEYTLSMFNTLNLLFDQYFNETEYKEKVKKIISLKVWRCFEMENDSQLQLFDDGC